jgi:hypothetical protein
MQVKVIAGMFAKKLALDICLRHLLQNNCPEGEKTSIG